MESLEHMLLRYFNEQKRLELLKKEAIQTFYIVAKFDDKTFQDIEKQISDCLLNIDVLKKDLQQLVGFKE